MRILGVEFGTWSLKAVEMESRFRRIDILDFHEVRLPLQITDPQATYRQAVEQLLARLPSYPEKLVTSLPASQTALRFLQMPLKQRKQVEKMYRFELEDSIPLKLEDAIVEHYVTKSKDGSLVFAAVAPKKHLQSHIDWLQSVGLDPDWLTFDGMGLVNLYLSSLGDKEELPPDPVMLLDIGHLKTNLAIFHGERLELFRSFGWGGAAITQALALNMNLSVEEAERCKITDLRLDVEAEQTAPELQEMVIAAIQALSPFVSDLSHSLVSFRNTYAKQVQSALITGGTSKIWGITGFLSASLQIPVEPFKPFEGLSIKEELKETGDEARFGEALGRAFVFARKASLLFNFRKQELAKGNSINEVTTFLKDPNILRLLKYVGVLAIILFIHVNVAGYLAESEAKVAQEELRKTFADTFRSVPAKLRTSLTNSPQDLKKFIDQKNKEMDQKLKMLTKSRVPIMSLILAVSDAFPPDVKVDVNTLQLDDRTFSMEGVLYQGDLNRVTENLKRVKSLSNVALSREGERFTFRGEVVGR